MTGGGEVKRTWAIPGHGLNHHYWPVKLTEDDVREIKERLRAGETNVRLAADYKVSRAAISHIRTGDRWGWVQ